MNILICVKQVPCVEKMKYDELTQTVLRQKDDLMLNPFDASTIEQALTLKQKYPSVHFTIMSMGTMHAKAMLKELLAYDIDRAVLLSDPVFAGSDTLATGYVLSKGIRCAGDYDLIFCGKQSHGLHPVWKLCARSMRSSHWMHEAHHIPANEGHLTTDLHHANP